MGGEDEAEPEAQASDEDAEMPSQPSPSHRPPAKATKRRAGQAARANAPSPEGPASAGAERSERRASKSAPTRSGRAPRTPQFADAVQLQSSGWAHAAARAHSPAANMRRVRQTGRSGRAAPQLQQPRMRLRQVLHLCTLNMSWSTMYRMFEMLASVS